MKKLLLFIILLTTVAAVCFSSCSPSGGASVSLKDTPFVDNNYNNSNSDEKNELVRIGDSLYYNYYGSVDYGLYRINEQGCERIYGGFAKNPRGELCGMDSFNNRLLFVGFSENDVALTFDEDDLLDELFDNLYYLNESNNKVEIFTTPCSKEDIKCFKVIGSKLYFFSDNSIYISDDGKQLKLIFNKVKDICNKYLSQKMCYIHNDDIYYISNGFKLKKCNFKSKAETVLCNLSNLTNDLDNFVNIYFYNNEVVIAYESYDSDTFELYSVNTSNGKLKKVYTSESEGLTRINAYKDNIFIYNDRLKTSNPNKENDNGLIKYNLSTGKIQALARMDIEACYIFDESYAYFITNYSILMRVPQNGGEAEKVFST